MENYTITLGYVPVRRDMFPDKPAAMMNQKIQVRMPFFPRDGLASLSKIK